FFGTHAIDEALQIPENRQQLIQNLKVHGLLNREHKEEIDQKFLTAEIDFSEYLLEMDFIRPFPRMNEKVGFNEIPEIITEYFGIIFPEQKNNFATTLQYRTEKPEYQIVFGQEHFIIETEEFLPRSFFYTDVWSDTRKPLPDSFIVTPEIFSSLR